MPFDSEVNIAWKVLASSSSIFFFFPQPKDQLSNILLL